MSSIAWLFFVKHPKEDHATEGSVILLEVRTFEQMNEECRSSDS